mmetsp:Transcript_24495/g.35074  ORF Transcript_24495/g.35074 Transcript_24495/m.35074 type:complete len:222 (+) Transcript_24495:71-736(+)|eukprot:CAMPEP_0201688166 /NCGR_PEP_ID=MMETSP0578-20130828/1934_1 /ASSEMBLY_ACC=CAM_ASM_000663 /TAXON_ID=267565 /ORGANISM="Skeletonema grethea, Strain CCMP 1804" /LENGTH=221 /DNA_ID=CAMNT_0048172389 /DNA_START=42 /DNA_END=707 /DNA_ORIENTATION=+
MAINWATELFGPKILTKPKTTGLPTESRIGGKSNKKLVALYFSASWCPPCKGFSPMLLDFHNSCKDDLDIVFVSSDRDEKTFNDYYQKLMPFMATVPAYASAEARQQHLKLAETFQIKGIPSVIVLDAKTGNFITDNARMEIMKATDEESKKALIQSWLEKKAVPIDQAQFGTDTSQSLLMKVVMYFVNRPVHAFGLYYLIKQGLKYLDELGRDEIEGGEL